MMHVCFPFVSCVTASMFISTHCICFLHVHFLFSICLKDFDPFVDQKEKAFHSSKVPMATLAHYVIQFTKGQPDSVEEAIRDREQLRLDFEMLFEVTKFLFSS